MDKWVNEWMYDGWTGEWMNKWKASKLISDGKTHGYLRAHKIPNVALTYQLCEWTSKEMMNDIINIKNQKWQWNTRIPAIHTIHIQCIQG